MRNILLLFACVLFLSSCSERRILKSSEVYLLSHLGLPESYKRIEWKIADTIFSNDTSRIEIGNKVNQVEDTIIKLKEVQKFQTKHINNIKKGNFKGNLVPDGNIFEWDEGSKYDRYYSGYFSDIDPQNGHADPLVGFISKN